LLTRVVKEELVSSSGVEADEKGSTNQVGIASCNHVLATGMVLNRVFFLQRQTFLPLVQKQWEILLPLRGQIVERATTSLRDRAVEPLEPKEAQNVSNRVTELLTMALFELKARLANRHWQMRFWRFYFSKPITTLYRRSWTSS
jgi:hypothetical protein